MKSGNTLEWSWKKQNVSQTWVSAMEAVAKVLGSTKTIFSGESNSDLCRKILMELGFKNESY